MEGLQQSRLHTAVGPGLGPAAFTRQQVPGRQPWCGEAEGDEWRGYSAKAFSITKSPGLALEPSTKPRPSTIRSEEHTSELQSLMRISYAVFCLKNKNATTTNVRMRRMQSHKILHITESNIPQSMKMLITNYHCQIQQYRLY